MGQAKLLSATESDPVKLSVTESYPIKIVRQFDVATTEVMANTPFRTDIHLPCQALSSSPQ